MIKFHPFKPIQIRQLIGGKRHGYYKAWFQGTKTRIYSRTLIGVLKKLCETHGFTETENDED